MSALPDIDLGLGGIRAGRRVVVAMSGGVDSAVTAGLIAQAGYETIGVTMRLYDGGASAARKGACCAGADIEDARRAAETIGVPHYVVDFENGFRKAVIDDFVAGYGEGRTPTPCIRCNQKVKFADLLAIARDLGADALATGHYARIESGALRTAADPAKDQSYFLFATTRAQLDFVRFPLGRFEKRETRRFARAIGLELADKPDSQDICFVPDGDYASLVRKLRPGVDRPGEIVDLSGAVLGRHGGVIDFTVGQRRGLGVALGERRYVLAIDPSRARVAVGPREALACRDLELEEFNWIGDGPPPIAPIALMAKHRAREPAQPARFWLDRDGTPRLRFEAPEHGVARGQACVLYSGDRCLGGGWIRSAPAIEAARIEAALRGSGGAETPEQRVDNAAASPYPALPAAE